MLIVLVAHSVNQGQFCGADRGWSNNSAMLWLQLLCIRCILRRDPRYASGGWIQLIVIDLLVEHVLDPIASQFKWGFRALQ